jgi:hypothetical protein
MQPYTHSNLYHFVGRKEPLAHATNVETIRKILTTKCIAHDPRQLGWGSQSLAYHYDESKRLIRGELVIPNMVCFCDIPPESLDVHMLKYGCCGLSLARNHLLRYGARPVQYFPYDPKDWGAVEGLNRLTGIERDFRAVMKYLRDNLPEMRPIGAEPKTPRQLLMLAETLVGREFLGYFKAFDATLPEDDPNNFYMEREWRRLGNMCFEPEHVGHILVPGEFVEPLRREYPAFASRIVDVQEHIRTGVGGHERFTPGGGQRWSSSGPTDRPLG